MSKTMWSLHKERERQLRFSLVAPVTVARLWHKATILYLRIARLTPAGNAERGLRIVNKSWTFFDGCII